MEMVVSFAHFANDMFNFYTDFRLVISGCAEVRWSERRTRDRKVTYTGKEDLLRAETKLIPESNCKQYVLYVRH